MAILIGQDEFDQALERRKREAKLARLAGEEWSYSMLDTFEKCPARFFQLYVEREPEPEFNENLGAAVHDAIRRYHEGCLVIGRPSDQKLAEGLASQLRQHPALSEADREQAAELLLAFQERHRFGPHIFSIEESFSAMAGPYTFTSTPDCVEWNEGTLKVTDYKSYWPQGSKPEEAPSQLRFYAWLMACALKASGQERPQKVLVGIEYLPTGGTWEWSLNSWELALVGAELEVTIKSILECRFWDARIGHCDYCGVTCPLLQADPPVALHSEDEAMQLGRWVTARGAQLGQIRKALHAWVHEHGPLIVDHARFEYRETNTPTYDIEQLVAALEGAGINWPALLKLDGTALKKIGPALDEADINIEEFRTGATVSTKFWEGKA